MPTLYALSGPASWKGRLRADFWGNATLRSQRSDLLSDLQAEDEQTWLGTNQAHRAQRSGVRAPGMVLFCGVGFGGIHTSFPPSLLPLVPARSLSYYERTTCPTSSLVFGKQGQGSREMPPGPHSGAPARTAVGLRVGGVGRAWRTGCGPTFSACLCARPLPCLRLPPVWPLHRRASVRLLCESSLGGGGGSAHGMDSGSRGTGGGRILPAPRGDVAQAPRCFPGAHLSAAASLRWARRRGVASKRTRGEFRKARKPWRGRSLRSSPLRRSKHWPHGACADLGSPQVIVPLLFMKPSHEGTGRAQHRPGRVTGTEVRCGSPRMGPWGW